MLRSGFAVLVVVAGAAVASAQEGPARAIDGDTLDVAGERVRLHGIDAPEREQTCTIDGREWECGIAAWDRMIALLAGQIASCERRDYDQYGRTVAVCRINGDDVNARMVADGWALAYRDYSLDYVPHEDAARAASIGLWQGEFVPPWEWRRGERLEAVEAAPEACSIKGNIARDGERIYHVLGGRYYEATVIDQARGEKWFCTEADAMAAGWRRSQL